MGISAWKGMPDGAPRSTMWRGDWSTSFKWLRRHAALVA
jgi:hypothetical protein